MNRRQFTASLAALFAAPAVPLAARVPAAVPPAVPAGAYAWAQLIARAQMQCSPEMLARSLNLSPAVARTLFKDMVVDGVLRAPGPGGVARAARPFQTTGLERSTTDRITTKARDMLRDALDGDTQRDAPAPLAKDDACGLGCADTNAKDPADASPNEPPQESPRTG